MIERGRELAAAFGLLTRLPVWRLGIGQPRSYARAVWAYPVVGCVVGLIGGGIHAALVRLGLAPALASVWTVAGLLLVTGALHEDGLADAADGFGGGATVARKLEIMRDSRIGAYGALALAVTLAVRGMSIAALGDPARVLTALVVAGGLARGTIVGLLWGLRAARPDGMAASLSAPPPAGVALGVLLPVAGALLLLPWGQAWVAVFAAVIASVAWGALARAQIGGQTGDVLGAGAVLCECAVLTALTL